MKIIDKVANRLAGKFRFGYHTLDDMKQQAKLFALQGLENYDGVRPLENFLWTHVRNRLYNFKRNNFERPDKPCLTCPKYLAKHDDCAVFDDLLECDLYRGWITRNTSKRNLMQTMESTTSCVSTTPSMELFEFIDQNLSVEFREDWIRLVHNLKLTKNKKDRLITEMLRLFQEANIDVENWQS